MDNTALTPAQRQFAADHHRLVYRFLAAGNLPKRDYYDIVIFGFLAAVRRYDTEIELHRYAFSTIAWRSMRQCVANHRRSERSGIGNIPTVSLDAPAGQEDERAAEGILRTRDASLDETGYRLLLHDLLARLSKRQRAVVRLKIAGYSNKEVARILGISPNRVTVIMKELRAAFSAITNPELDWSENR